MEVKLLHLYDDVMNLYGEYANVAILARYLTDLGHTVSVDTLSLYEEKDISAYDFYFMGAGTERRQKLALSQLGRYREALQRACDAGKVMLFTGNSFELLGARLQDAEGKPLKDCISRNSSARRVSAVSRATALLNLTIQATPLWALSISAAKRPVWKRRCSHWKWALAMRRTGARRASARITASART